MYYGERRPTRRLPMRDGRRAERMPRRERIGEDYGRRYDYGYDYGYDYDYEDYGKSGDMRLTKDDMREWKRRLRNVDGSVGEHFTKDQLTRYAEQMGVRYDGYSESDLCMTANMLYSDYAEALRPYVPADKEPVVYLRMAKAFLEDEDAPEGSEKLALYYWSVVNGGEA